MGLTLTLVSGNTRQETEMLWSASIDRRREALSGEAAMPSFADPRWSAPLDKLGRWRG
jgi:hypothetical protein